MSGKNFFEIPYRPPEPRAPDTRAHDHAAAVPGLQVEDAVKQASRCVSCDAPGCNTGCPVGQDIPSFLKAVERGDWLKAHQVAFKSPLYGLFGQLCPQDEGLCQTHCTVAKVTSFGASLVALPSAPIKDTIAIGAVESTIWRKAVQAGWLRYPTPKQETGKSVAIIGAGPAGLYAAIALREKGHSVTVIDGQSEIGGLLFNGIPTFKLPKDDLPIVREAMEKTGIKFQLNMKVGDQGSVLPLSRLLSEHDAVLLAIGTDKARAVTHPGSSQAIEGSERIIPALDFLFAHGDAAVKGIPLQDKYQVAGKRIVILGNGDTAADCIGETARDAGAQQIITLQRSNKTTGAYKDKKLRFEEAKAVGAPVEVIREVTPLSLKDQDGQMVLSVVGRNHEETKIPCDLVINATGFEKPNLDEIFGLRTNEQRKLFVAGDAATGATLVVHAAQSGRDMASRIHSFLGKPTL